jgi:hypothetical protein
MWCPTGAPPTSSGRSFRYAITLLWLTGHHNLIILFVKCTKINPDTHGLMERIWSTIKLMKMISDHRDKHHMMSLQLYIFLSRSDPARFDGEFTGGNGRCILKVKPGRIEGELEGTKIVDYIC